MSETKPVFLIRKAKKQSGQSDSVLWCSDDFDAASATLDYLLIKSGRKLKDYFKAVATHFPVVNELPPEGEISFTFCDYYQLGADGMTWEQIPSVTLPSRTNEKVEESANTTETDDVATTDTKTDSDDTAGDPLPAYAYNVNGELMSEVEKDMTQSVSGKSFAVRFRANWQQPQCVTDVATWQPQEINAELMDPTGYMADIELALSDKEISSRLDKLEMRDVHCYARDIEKVFPENKRPGIQHVREFTKAWLDTDYIDRGLLVKEWQNGNRVSCIIKPTANDAPEPQKTKVVEAIESARPCRSEKPTFRTINYELACGFYEDLDLNNLRPAMDFAKRIIAEDREDWKRMSATVGIIPDIKEFDRQTIIDLVRKAPAAVHSGSPELRRAWCESFLAVHGVRDPDWYEYVPDEAPTTHEENAARLRQAGKCLRDIEAGRFQCDEEKPQPAGELADEPATPEAVEQDTTEHHPDPLPLENEPPVSQTEAGYQKIRAELHEARKNIQPKNPVDVGKQLAAARGEYVEGISDPNDPKWVHNDYSASNQGEKTEVGTGDAADTADYVDHSEEFSSQPEPETSHSEPSADQNEPESPETEPESQKPEPVTKVADGVFDVSAFFADTSNQGEKKEDPQPTSDAVTASALEGEFISSQEWPTYFEYGRYEDIPNSAYHAADGISSSMLKDARISLMYFYGRYIAGTIKRETSDAFTMGSLVHTLVLEPAKFDEEYAVFPCIPAGAFTSTDSLKAFIREYNADKPKGEQLKLTGKKEELQESILAVKPDAIFADEYEQQWLENIGDKTVLTGEQLQLAKAMQQAVLSDSVAGYYVNHPSRSVEVSYFGMDEDTEMDVRVRPDLEITIDNERVGIDLKTISMGRVRQDMLRARLHREIIDRDYHVSAAMYCDVANLDKFYWIFVNKDVGYHWVAVVEASREEIELGRLEYRKTMLALKKAYDSGVWPAPITEQYTDNLNDYDLRRLEMLSEQV
ncbi:PD-(D/E)XK nuclease-like domain-containing protein [Salmonella enterica]|nr:PD-(D/E)XK nuclease-like domain-containing protein [Salmonella enterica]